MAEPVITTNPNPDTRRSDGEVFKMMYDVAYRELAGLGTHQARDREAYKIAETARKGYVWATTQKQPPEPPASALRGAYASTLGFVRQVASSNGIAMASSDETLQAELDSLSAPASQPPGTRPGAPGSDPTKGEGTVTSGDVKAATDVYRGGIESGQTLYDELLKRPVNDPNARNVGREIVGYEQRQKRDAKGNPVWKLGPDGKPLIDPRGPGPDGGLIPETEDDPTKPIYGKFVGVGQRDVTAAQQGEVDPLTAALQARTQVAGTNAAGLEAIARGEGPAALAAALQNKLAVQRNAQVASGAAAQARGSERRGARALGILQGAEQALQLQDQAAARAQEAAVGATTKLADLDRQTKDLQASLDQAKAAGDQTAFNDITKKMADLKASREQFNVGETNRTATDNANRGVSVETTNIREERAGIEAGSQQDERQARLLADLQKAKEASAQGLLNEAQRQELIRQAQAGLKLAQEQLKLQKDEAARKAKQDEVNTWLAILNAATSLGTSLATKASDRRVKQDVTKVSADDLEAFADAVARSMSTYRHKEGTGLPEGEQVGVPSAQELEKSRLGRAVVSEDENGMKRVDYGTLAVLLAAAALKRKKGIA